VRWVRLSSATWRHVACRPCVRLFAWPIDTGVAALTSRPLSKTGAPRPFPSAFHFSPSLPQFPQLTPVHTIVYLSFVLPGPRHPPISSPTHPAAAPPWPAPHRSRSPRWRPSGRPDPPARGRKLPAGEAGRGGAGRITQSPRGQSRGAHSSRSPPPVPPTPPPVPPRHTIVSSYAPIHAGRSTAEPTQLSPTSKPISI
jgi:hypothetical protein